jgi:hypothetical protein
MSRVTICPYCSVALFDPKVLEPHIELEHQCPLCPMRLRGQVERHAHIRIVHGKTEGVREPVYEEEVFAPPPYEDIENWQSPLESIEVPRDAQTRAEWLYPFCLSIAEVNHPELAWESVPESLRDQARYVELHFTSVVGALELARYQRLKTTEARAHFLARALTMPEHKASYAEQKVAPEIDE